MGQQQFSKRCRASGKRLPGSVTHPQDLMRPADAQVREPGLPGFAFHPITCPQTRTRHSIRVHSHYSWAVSLQQPRKICPRITRIHTNGMEQEQTPPPLFFADDGSRLTTEGEGEGGRGQG